MEQARIDRRFFLLIEYLPTAMGRSEKLNPMELFPSLKRMKYSERDEDADPAESFAQAKAAIRGFIR